MRVYADAAAYETYHGLDPNTAPANVDRLLRVASLVVDTLLRARVYDVDTAGYPTDPDHVEALSDATCAIAGDMDADGTLEAGATGEWDTVKIATVSLSGRRQSAEAVRVGGVLVPPAALLHLGGVGRTVVYAR